MGSELIPQAALIPQAGHLLWGWAGRPLKKYLIIEERIGNESKRMVFKSLKEREDQDGGRKCCQGQT